MIWTGWMRVTMSDDFMGLDTLAFGMNYEIQVMHIISSRGRNSRKIIVTCVLSAYFFPFSQLQTPNTIPPSPLLPQITP